MHPPVGQERNEIVRPEESTRPVIRIAIVDDEPKSRQLLLDYIDQYRKESGERFDVVDFADGSEIAAQFRPQYDVVFLDVDMQHLDGFATARVIREVDPAVVIVFVTNLAQFAIRGYEVDALSYLLKPLPYFAFSQEMKRSIERVARRERRWVVLTVNRELMKIDAGEIVFVESIKHQAVVHTLAGKITVTGSLREFESTLGEDFFRSNSCYLVNLKHVTGVLKTSCTLVGGHDLQVSRARRKDLLSALTDYVGGRAG